MLRDQILECRSCGTRFLFSSAQKRDQLDGAGRLSPPDLCPGCLALQALEVRHSGVVRWYDARKGYGMIRDQQGDEVFVHRSSLRTVRRRLSGGQVVTYLVQDTDRGPVARDVQGT